MPPPPTEGKKKKPIQKTISFLKSASSVFNPFSGGSSIFPKFTSKPPPTSKASLAIDTSTDTMKPTDEEVVSPTRTFRESNDGRRMSESEQEYPPSKKSTDGKTLYQKSLQRQPKPEDQPQSSTAFTNDPDTTLIHAFEQLSSPSSQRVYDVSPLLDQRYDDEGRPASPSPQSRVSLDSSFNEKKKSESMLVRDSAEMEEDDDVQYISEKKLKVEKEVVPVAGLSSKVVSSKIALPALSEAVTKKNFNKMVLESGLLDEKWNSPEVDIVATLKRDTRFVVVADEKLKGYKSNSIHNLVKGLKQARAIQADKFAIEQKRRESKWEQEADNLALSKETYQLQHLLDMGNIDGYAIESVQAGGSADIVLTAASTGEYPLSWSEKLLLPVYLPIEAKSSFLSSLNGNQRHHVINGLAGHPDCAAFLSFYQYDSESRPSLFAVVLAKKVEVILRYITVSNAGLAMISYTPTIINGLLTKIQWNDSMKKCAKDKDVVVRTINDFTAEQLENPEWVIRQFIDWVDPDQKVGTVADFQSESLGTQKGNLGEELTSIAFHSVTGAVSRQGESITNDKVDLWMIKGDVEVSISCKTIGANHGNFNEWRFPLTERFEGQTNVPVTIERSCDVWTATVHNDLIDPNFITLKPPKGTHWIVFVFTKSQLKDRLGLKQYKYLKAGEHLEHAIYFNAEKVILNPEVINRLIASLFEK